MIPGGTLLIIDEPFGGAPTTWEFAIDQAAGSRVAIPVVLTSSWEGLNATLRLEAGGQLIASDEIRRFPDGRGDTPLVGVGGPGVCFCSVPKEPVEGAFRASYPRLARCMYFRQRWCLLILLMK